MAVVQTITAVKASGVFSSTSEAIDDYATASNSVAMENLLDTAYLDGKYEGTSNWDQATTTLTFNRTWHNNADYDAYVTARSSDASQALANSEVAGWTVTESTSTS